MNENIPDPIRGGDVLPWAKGVTEVCRRVGGIGSGNLLVREGPGGVGFEALPENKRGKKNVLIFPWKVEWCQTEIDGEGAFIIYLPTPGSYTDTTDKTTDAVEGAIGDLEDSKIRNTPWKIIDGVGETGGTVYLTMHQDTSGSGVTTTSAKITTSESAGEGDINIPIAEIEIETDEDTGSVTRRITQFVYGELVVSDPFATESGESGEAYIEAITDLEFSLIDDPENPYKKKLVVDITRKRIYGSKVEDVKPEQKEVATGIEEVSVVEKSEYDVETHQFNNTKKKLMVLGKTADNDELVFQATPHSAEHPGGVV